VREEELGAKARVTCPKPFHHDLRFEIYNLKLKRCAPPILANWRGENFRVGSGFQGWLAQT
jgi:hypothetical protein